ncbi:hypothetical protein [Massilioclostridium coli]|uniref:hypothetical protein n=1 Tax=Massilioclostridium coli TaxID=1870991 RepID=UPI00085BF94F|nr:hypothetical protein [Massilioclostridium coli]
MKIVIKQRGKIPLYFGIPHRLLTGKAIYKLANLILKEVGKHHNMVPYFDGNDLEQLALELKRTRKQYGKLVLVEVDDCNGDYVKIQL